MVRRLVWLACIASAALFSGIACNPTAATSDQEDEKNAYFQKAKKHYQEREFKKAVEYYRKALETAPNNAAAHFELGLLYDNELQDYSYAIYHYRRYLELRPDAEKAEYVKQFVDRCQLALAASMPNSPLVSAEEISRLNAENSNLLRQVEWLMATNQVLEFKLAKMSRSPEEALPVQVVTQFVAVAQGQVSGVSLQPGPTTAVAVASTHQPAEPTATQQAQSSAAKPRTYVVRKGDTLMGISEKMYGRRDKWQVIYKANRGVIGSPPSYNLKIGQVLTIPKLPG